MTALPCEHSYSVIRLLEGTTLVYHGKHYHLATKARMANEMKVHLFKVRTMDGAQPLENLLTAIQGDPLENRLRTLSYQEIRLESLRAPTTRGNPSPYWLLDFTKLRFEHGPGKISRDAAIEGFELEEDQGFGEETAALFDPASQHLLIQYNHNGPRSGRIEEYFCNYENAVVDKYALHIVLDDTANVRLAQKDIITKIQFKVASPRITAAQRAANVPLSRVIDMANNMNGETVDVTISAGHGRLTMQTVQNMIGTLRNMMVRRDDPVEGPLKTFKITGKSGINGESDEINMLLSKQESTIDGLEMGADRRYTRESRWNGLLRARRGWNAII